MRLNDPLPISPSYRGPLFQTVAWQVGLGVFSGLVFDGGILARICLIASITFWAGALVVICRRPQSPTKTDLKFLKDGYLPLMLVATALVFGVRKMKGID